MSYIVKMGKNILFEFEWNNWPEYASGNIASQTLRACLEKANLRDVLPGKRCISAQRCCSAAICLKSTGSAPAVATTVSKDVRRGRDRKSATTFFQTWQIQKLYIKF